MNLFDRFRYSIAGLIRRPSTTLVRVGRAEPLSPAPGRSGRSQPPSGPDLADRPGCPGRAAWRPPTAGQSLRTWAPRAPSSRWAGVRPTARASSATRLAPGGTEALTCRPTRWTGTPGIRNCSPYDLLVGPVSERDAHLDALALVRAVRDGDEEAFGAILAVNWCPVLLEDLARVLADLAAQALQENFPGEVDRVLAALRRQFLERL